MLLLWSPLYDAFGFEPLNFVPFYIYIWMILLHFIFSPLPFPLSTTEDFEDSMNETKCWHGLAEFPDKINIKLNVRHMP